MTTPTNVEKGKGPLVGEESACARHPTQRSPNGPPLVDSSYAQIFQSTSIMGGVAIVGLVLGMVRTKVAALIIGPTGTGLVATLVTIQGLIGTVVGLGVHSSSVREIASAVASGNRDKVDRTATILLRVCWAAGLLGASVTLAMSPLISAWTFGTEAFRWQVAALSITVLLATAQGGWLALLQGARKVGTQASVQLATGVATTASTAGIYIWLGTSGIIPALIIMGFLQCVIAAFAARTALPRRRPQSLSIRETLFGARRMVRLGVAMMWTGLLGSAVAYGTNALVNARLGFGAVGIYSAAFALSGMFINVILGAMGTDYYPRLAAVSGDPKSLNRLANEQTEIGLLLAVPGILATMVFAPIVVRLFYSVEFLSAVDLLKWFLLGCLGRVISWPIGFLMIAMSRAKLLVVTETSANVVHILLIYAGLRWFGLVGVAMAFFALYLFHIGVVFLAAKMLTGFSWSRHSKIQLAFSLAFTGGGWLAAQMSPSITGTTLGLGLVAVATLHSTKGLAQRLGPAHPVGRLSEVVLHRLCLNKPRRDS